MKKIVIITSLCVSLVLSVACTSSPEVIATRVAIAANATVASWTATPIASATPTNNPTVTSTPNPTNTPTNIPTSSPVPLRLDPISEVNASNMTNLAVIRFEGDDGPEQMAFSPDGLYIVIVSVSRNPNQNIPMATVSVRNAGTGKIVSQIDVPSNVVINSDGLHVIAYSDNEVRVYEAIGGKVIAEQEIGSISGSLCFSPDRSYLAIKRSNSKLEIWDVKKGVSVSDLTVDGYIHSAAFSRDNGSLAIRSFDHVFVFDTRTGGSIVDILSTSADKQFSTGDAAISPDGAYVAINGETTDAAGLQLWDVHNDKLLATWNNGTNHSYHGEMAFSPDGRWIAYAIRSGSMDTTFVDKVYLLDVKTGKLQRTLSAASGLAFSQDGQFFASAMTDGVVNLWGLKNGALLASLHGHGPQVESILFNPDGTLLASLGFEQTIRLWGIPPAGVSVARSGVSVYDQGIGFSGLSGDIPTSWLAKGASPARYQIDLTLRTPTLKSCPYTNNYTLYLKQWNVTATITDLENNRVVAQQTFNGKYNSLTCPQTYTFYSMTAEEDVGRPDPAEFKAWLQSTMAPLGFAP